MAANPKLRRENPHPVPSVTGYFFGGGIVYQSGDQVSACACWPYREQARSHSESRVHRDARSNNVQLAKTASAILSIQNLEPGFERNTRSSGVLSRPNTPLR